jgi:hypothetical protein
MEGLEFETPLRAITVLAGAVFFTECLFLPDALFSEK